MKSQSVMLILVAIMAFATHADGIAADEGKPCLSLKRSDGSTLPIVVASDAAPHTRAAAKELASCVEAIGGVRPKVIEGVPDPLPAQAVWVGYQPALNKLFPNADFAFKHPEEIFLIGNENHIAITGRDVWDPKYATVPGRRFPITNWQKEHGNANAVYTFLQDVVGVRWLYPGALGTDYPGVDSLNIQPFTLRYHPRLRSREGLFHQLARGYIKVNDEQDWARHNRVLLHSLDAEFGHPFKDWWEKYGKTRPELFALQPDGTRGTYPKDPQRRKICEGEPLVWEVWLEEQRKMLAANPLHSVLGAAPNDSYFDGHCTDPRSRAWDPAPSETDIRIQLNWADGVKKEWPPLSDRYVTFANTLAERVEKRFPNKHLLVATNAYGDVGKPKPVRAIPRDNVLIICVANFHGRGPTMRKEEMQVFSNWAGISKQMIWRPNLGTPGGRFWAMPDVALQQTIEDFRFIAERRAIGVMFDMLYEHWAPNAPYYYLLCQLAWNPQADGNAILDDYYQRCYGPAAAPMKEYWALLEATRNAMVNKGDNVGSAFLLPAFYTAEVFARAEALIARARQAAAGSDKYTARVAFTECGLRFAKAITEIRSLMTQFEKAPKAAREAIGSQVLARWEALSKTVAGFPAHAVNFNRFGTDPAKMAGNRRIGGLHPSAPTPGAILRAIKNAGLDQP